MKWNEHERPRANPGGVVSSGQQAEMKLLLAGGWPSLKPLPVFKYESADCRASIEFDKGRGEWVCRKTFFPSNNVQELRGGLAELAKALPPALGEAALTESSPQRGQEFAREAGRRLQAILEWKAKFENGALYSELLRHLSESQQQEIEEILRLTLTARQLQFSPKNISCVFDGLSKAGGRLATLLEVAKRKKTLQVAADAAVNEEPPAADSRLHEQQSGQPFETVEDPPAAEIENVFAAQKQSEPAELAAVDSAAEETISVPRGSRHTGPPTFFVESVEDVDPPVSVTAFQREFRKHKLDATADRTGNFLSRRRALEISGVHIAAFAVLFLFAVISLPIGLTVGRGPIGQWLRDVQQTMFTSHVAPAAPVPPRDTTSRVPAPELENTSIDTNNGAGTTKPDDIRTREENSGESAENSEFVTETPSAVSNFPPTTESKPSTRSSSSAVHDVSAGTIMRVAPPPPKPADSLKAKENASRAWNNRGPRNFAPPVGASPRRAASSGILVTTPAHGSKPFRVNFPEKAIAASSSFAMTSELSVLVPPDPGSSAAHSSRLRAGELTYFVWPRYSRKGDRYGSAETVRMRATVGQFGQVLDVKLLSGSNALFPSARNAVHLWHYRPTLLNGRPITVQQDITIEFRPPQYLSQVHTQHPAHN